MSNTLISISSVPAATVNSDQMQIIASWKSTEKRTIPAANKNRAIILPLNIWSTGEQIANVTDKNLRQFILEGIEELARKYLSLIVEDSNWLRSEVPLEDFSMTALLQWQVDQSAMAGRLNGEDIKKWLLTSATILAFKETYGEPAASSLGDTMVRLAGPNHKLTPDDAGEILTKLWKESDSDSLTGLKLQNRLTGIMNKKPDPVTENGWKLAIK